MSNLCSTCRSAESRPNQRNCYACHAAAGKRYRARIMKIVEDRRTFRGGLKDMNHDEVIQEFRAAGATVIDTRFNGGGFPDLIVGAFGANHFVEVKNLNHAYGRSGQSQAQIEMFRDWRGAQVWTVSRLSDIAALMRAWDSRGTSLHSDLVSASAIR